MDWVNRIGMIFEYVSFWAMGPEILGDEPLKRAEKVVEQIVGSRWTALVLVLVMGVVPAATDPFLDILIAGRYQHSRALFSDSQLVTIGVWYWIATCLLTFWILFVQVAATATRTPRGNDLERFRKGKSLWLVIVAMAVLGLTGARYIPPVKEAFGWPLLSVGIVFTMGVVLLTACNSPHGRSILRKAGARNCLSLILLVAIWVVTGIWLSLTEGMPWLTRMLSVAPIIWLPLGILAATYASDWLRILSDDLQIRRRWFYVGVSMLTVGMAMQWIATF